MPFDFPTAPIEGQMFAPAGGPLYVYNNPVWKVAGITTIPGEWVINERIVTASETYTKPANLAYLEAWVQAGGGGGGPSNTAVASEVSLGYGGGGGGAVYKLFDAADLPASISITVPAAALAAVAGGTVIFGSTVPLQATGGGAGAIGTSSGATPAFTGGATPGVGSGGDLNLKGGYGGGATRLNGSYGLSGSGGAAPFGSPGVNGVVGTSSGTAGSTGDGGSGGNRTGSGGAAAGGAGGAPYIRLREYYPAWVLAAAYPPGTIRILPAITTSQPYVKQPGLRYLRVKLCAGGGGGGYGRSAAAQTSGGIGGGGGGYAESLIPASSLAVSEAITIGAGGVGGIGATPVGAAAGGTTSFGSLVAASGGAAGGQQATTGAAWALRGAGPGGGTIGDIRLLGSYSGYAVALEPTGVNAGAGSNGGDSKLGTGGTGGWANTDGLPGYAGGGGGGTFASASQSTNGGAGGAGVAYLEEIY